MKVLNIGSLNIDRVYGVDHFVRPGDTFCGYFLPGITKGREIPEILKTASAASAIAVSRNGAAPSIPEYEEVEKFVAERE